jgi:hypothetical protein
MEYINIKLISIIPGIWNYIISRSSRDIVNTHTEKKKKEKCPLEETRDSQRQKTTTIGDSEKILQQQHLREGNSAEVLLSSCLTTGVSWVFTRENANNPKAMP